MMRIEETDNNIVALAIWPDFLPAQGMAVIANRRDPITAFLTTLATEQRLDSGMRQHMEQNPEQAFQGMVDRFGMILVVKIEGEISYYARSRKNRLPVAALKRLESFFDIWPEIPVGWFRSVEGQHVETPAGVAFYGRSERQLRREKPIEIKPRVSKVYNQKKAHWAAKNPDLATSYTGLESAYDIVDKLLK